MMKAQLTTKGLLVAAALLTATCGAALAAGGGGEDGNTWHTEKFPSLEWSFDGVFGTYDRAALQRGYQVYNEVCSACHGMRLLAYRNLEGIGFSPEEVKAIAAKVEVEDGPDEFGDMFTRPGLPSDHFKSPFPNVEAARAANGGAAPPDFSLLAKRTAYGPNYIFGILTGYEDDLPANADFKLQPGQYFNKYKGAFSMAPPLFDDMVEYSDGTPATLHQMASDVSNFLMWAAEPHMETRKQTGIKAILFLLVFTVILYAVKRKVWAKLH
ncbi:MAG: cytochrome c1 [Kiloniellales bacterium]